MLVRQLLRLKHGRRYLMSFILCLVVIFEARASAFVVSSSRSCLQHAAAAPLLPANNFGPFLPLCASGSEWNGEVVSNTADGKIQGCSITAVSDSVTEWIVTIDGVEADLAKFSQAVYKKILADAKQQRFQGFRPGTIPPHLEPTYRAFTMDECARETILEALQQNNIRPFESARSDMTLERFCIPAVEKKSSSKKKSKKGSVVNNSEQDPEPVSDKPQWLQFDDMKSAIDAGWKPGQSFSFVAKNVKGQKIKDEAETAGATVLGVNY